MLLIGCCTYVHTWKLFWTGKYCGAQESESMYFGLTECTCISLYGFSLFEYIPLEMVDAIISASKCGSTMVRLKSTVNSFVERKISRLNSDKWVRIHIAKKHKCAPVKVPGVDMKNSVKEKYLGKIQMKL